MWAVTKLKDFKNAPSIRKIDMPKLLTLGMNNPVEAAECESNFARTCNMNLCQIT